MNKNQVMLVIALNPLDPLVYCGGTILKYIQEQNDVHIFVISDGLGSYKINADSTMPSDKELQTSRAAYTSMYQNMGVKETVFLGENTIPFAPDNGICAQIAQEIHHVQPDFIVTYAKELDVDNLEFTKVAEAVVRARYMAKAVETANEDSTFKRKPLPVFGMEPFRAENCGWYPGLMIDITSTEEQKEKEISKQPEIVNKLKYYQQKARHRGVHASGRGGKKGCKYAEAFSFFSPVYGHNELVW